MAIFRVFQMFIVGDVYGRQLCTLLDDAHLSAVSSIFCSFGNDAELRGPGPAKRRRGRGRNGRNVIPVVYRLS